MKFKKLLTLGLVILLTFSFAACSVFEEDEEDKSSEEESKVVIEAINVGDVIRDGDEEISEISLDYEGEVESYNWIAREKGVDDEDYGDFEGEGSEVVFIFPVDAGPGTIAEIKVGLEDEAGETYTSDWEEVKIPDEGLSVGEIELEEENVSVNEDINLSIEAENRSGDNDEIDYAWYQKESYNDEWELLTRGEEQISFRAINETHFFKVEVEIEDDSVTREKTVGVEGIAPDIESLEIDPDDDHIYYELTDEVEVTVEANDPNPGADNEDLTYEWSANPGDINEDEAGVAIYEPGHAQENDEVTIKVYVSNDYGRAEKEINFTLNSPSREVTDMRMTPDNPVWTDSVALEVFFDGDIDNLVWRLYDQDDANFEKTLSEGETRVAWDPQEPGNYKLEVDYPDENDQIQTFESEGIRVDAQDPGLDKITVSGNFVDENKIRIGEVIDLFVDDGDIDKDPKGGEHSYRWSLDGVGETTDVDEDHIEFKGNELGDATIELEFSNEEGGSTTRSEDFVVISNDPEIDQIDITAAEDLAYEDISVGTNLDYNTTIYNDDTISLSAEATDPDGFDLEYRWMRGHREIGRGETIEYTPTDENMMPGDTHRIRLVVVDGEGGRVEENAVEISLANRAPEIDRVVGTGEITAGTDRNFRVIAEDPDGGDLEEEWSADQGDIDDSGNYQAPETAGEDTVIVTVTDSYGDSDKYEFDVEITESDLVITSISISDSLLPVREETRVNVAVDDPEDAELDYSWNVDGDGEIVGEGRSVTYKAPDFASGSVIDTISVTVEDVDETSRYDTANREIEVKNIWVKSYDSGEFQAGIDLGWNYLLTGNTGDEWSKVEIDGYGEINEGSSGEGHNSDNNSFNDIIELGLTDEYFVVGQTGDSGYIKNTANEEDAMPGDALYGVEELISGDYVVVGEESGSGYIEVRSDEMERDWFEEYGSQLNAVVEDGEKIVVAGEEETDTFNRSAYLISTDSSGNEIESKVYDDIAAFTDLNITADGGYVMTSKDGQLVRVDGELTYDWSRNHGEQLNAVIESGTGYLAVGNDSTGAYVVKTDNNGNEKWSESFGGTERFNGAIRVSDGYILFGTDGNDQFVAKVDRDGNSAQ